jgi:hypothetical protein
MPLYITARCLTTNSDLLFESVPSRPAICQGNRGKVREVFSADQTWKRNIPEPERAARQAGEKGDRIAFQSDMCHKMRRQSDGTFFHVKWEVSGRILRDENRRNPNVFSPRGGPVSHDLSMHQIQRRSVKIIGRSNFCVAAPPRALS